MLNNEKQSSTVILFHSPSYPCLLGKEEVYLHPSACICEHPGACACPSPCYCPRACGCPCPSPCTCPLPQYSKTPQQEYFNFREEKFGALYIDKMGKTYASVVERDDSKFDYSRPFVAPITIRWDITYKCNLSCPHCYSNSSLEYPIGISFEEIKNILYFLRKTGVFTIQFLGGEPFIRPDFIEICREASKLGFLIYVNTNGTLLNKRKIKELKEIENLIAIQIGLDGIGDTHNNFRGAEIFDRVITNISLMREELGEVIFIGIVTTLRKENIQELESLLRLCKDLKVSSVQILTVSPSGRGENTYEQMKLSEEDVKYANVIIKKFENVLQVDPVGLGRSIMDRTIMETKNVVPTVAIYGCEAGTISLSLDPWGNLHLCSLLSYYKNIYVDIKNLQSHSDLFNIYERLYFYRETLTKKKCEGKCQFYSDQCFGECLVW